MVTTVLTGNSERLGNSEVKFFKPKITVFHCINSLSNTSLPESEDYEIKAVKMPCSSMTHEIFLLKAFEGGADAVAVAVCPEGSCRYLEGNIRAGKRVARMKTLLDEIGVDGRRLNIYHVRQGDQSMIEKVIDQTLSDLAILGPNPAS